MPLTSRRVENDAPLTSRRVDNDVPLTLFYDDVTVCSIFITMVKVRPFVGGVVFVVVLFLYLYVFIILRARHDHNKIAFCGIIKLFLIELN